MYCTSCGAEYGETEQSCPYCGSENMALAKKRKQELLEEYDREAEEMETSVPRQEIKRRTKRLLKLLPAVLLLAVVLAAGAGIYARVSVNWEYRAKQKHLRNLETLFQEADWSGMEAYCREHSGLYGAEFEKYREVITAYEWLTYLKENVESLEALAELSFSSEENKEETYRSWGKLVLDDAEWVLSVCRAGMEDDVFRGNEQELEALYGECAEILRGMGCTEEEIGQMAAGETAENREELLESLCGHFGE